MVEYLSLYSGHSQKRPKGLNSAAFGRKVMMSL
jgi:hypothetical protein